MEWKKEEYVVSDDKAKLQLNAIHEFLTHSYWSKGVSEAIVKKSIENSLTFGLYKGVEQIGFAKMITDKATFAYLADVFVLEKHQGHGLGKWLVECTMSHPDLQGLRRIMLATRDAQKLYEKLGFTPLHAPERFMQVWNPNVYQ